MKKADVEYIEKATEESVKNHLSEIGDGEVINLYRSVLDSIEKPLLEVVMKYTRGNQSRAADCLGINRATLRSKLIRHEIIEKK